MERIHIEPGFPQAGIQVRKIRLQDGDLRSINSVDFQARRQYFAVLDIDSRDQHYVTFQCRDRIQRTHWQSGALTLQVVFVNPPH